MRSYKLPKVYVKKKINSPTPFIYRRNGNLRNPNWVTKVKKNIPPQYKKNIQTLGSGTTTRYVEREYELTTSATVNTVGITNIANTSNEFSYLCNTYLWFKMDYVTITIYPSSQNTITKWLMNWQNDTINIDDIEFSDSTKIVQVHQFRNQYLKYRTPNAIIKTGLTTTETSVINYKTWISTKALLNDGIYNLPGSILVKVSQGESVVFRVSLRFRFRGAIIPDSSTLMNMLSNSNKNNQAINKRISILKEAINHIKERNNNKIKEVDEKEDDEESQFDEEDERFIQELEKEWKDKTTQ